jgi:glycosyltransferase involved in cell wall biosynthesis
MRTAVHVLPHPGGGGERYVDLLERMDGYRFERVYLAPSPSPSDALRALPRTWWSSLRKADILHVHGEVAAEVCLPSLAARRSVVTLHGLHLLRRSEGSKRRVAVTGLRLVVRAANRTICVAEAERLDVLAAVGDRAGSRLVAIHNGVDVPEPISDQERVDARTSLALDSSDVVAAYVGGLDEHKGILLAAQAAAGVAEAGTSLRLIVAGDGPLRPDLERMADRGDTIRLLGHRTDLRTVLAGADFFVLPSSREGLSMALLEAMAAGLPSVVSDAPGNPEAVGEAGIVATRGDLRGLEAAFRELLDADTRRSLGSAARERVIRLFDAAGMVARTQRVYDEVLRRG